MKHFLIFVISILCINKFHKCSEEANNIDLGVPTKPNRSKPLWNETDVDRLREHLLTGYDKFTNPKNSDNINATVTKVILYIHLRYLQTYERNSTVIISSRLNLQWRDAKLEWDTDDYNGIKQVRMLEHQVWLPEVILHNKVPGSDTTTTHHDNSVVYVKNFGTIKWAALLRSKVLCEFDLYRWPFDTQQCYLKFVSRIHSKKQMQLNLDFNTKRKHLYDIISNWKVEMIGKVYNKSYICCPNQFSTVEFEVTLIRKWSLYVTVVVVPIIVVIGLILMQCCLPCNSKQRIILNCCTVLIVVMLLSYFMPEVPAMGNSTPWIIIFYITCLYMVSISMAVSISVLLILKNEQKQPLPGIIREQLRGKLGKLLFLEKHVLEFYTSIQQHTEEVNDDYSPEHEGNAMIKSNSKGLIQQEWEIFAIAIDRAVVLIYSVIFFVLILCYII
ncbi:hypothetical protein ILUMI_20898 [Ignelater luminosus]|uniref:Neurotransmitter-gated ion-channel ligand-binding domain-containing protein n=1 Tax=Ignelater luminosus TaxID=2038154 RepID=A0A8K0CD89_IGNLU|nr:hypothetical protein ILUMI_20898 [Ignelater luminosus]